MWGHMENPLRVPAGMSFSIPIGDSDQSQDNYGFVMNVSKLVGVESFNLCSGHELRRAKPAEIDVIHQILASWMTTFVKLPWEWKLPAVGQIETLPEAQWRYHVISFRGSNETLAEIERACDLAPLEIKIGFVVLHSPSGSGLMMHPGRLFQFLENVMRIGFLEVSASDINAIRLILEQLRQHDERLVEVRRLLQQLQDLEAIPVHSPLRFLGYFAVLEALLTHPPKPTDPYDSITRQIKKKVALVDHRCTPPIDYGEFGNANRETIWSKMYEYRSGLAHGGMPNFNADLQVLGSHPNAMRLIKESVKAVVRQALVEPQLLADLKDC
jgi:hypothetical protein